MMIKLSDGCYVAADQISEVRINEYSSAIVVRTKDGLGHSHHPEGRQSIYAALDALISKINSAERTP